MTKKEKRYEFVLRMPPELGKTIKAIAKANRRKINEELLIAIERHAKKLGPTA